MDVSNVGENANVEGEEGETGKRMLVDENGVDGGIVGILGALLVVLCVVDEVEVEEEGNDSKDEVMLVNSVDDNAG